MSKLSDALSATVNGVSIIVVPPAKVANEKLSPAVTVSKEFRESFDEWLTEIFGYTLKETLEDGQVFQTPDGFIMNQKTASLTTSALKNER